MRGGARAAPGESQMTGTECTCDRDPPRAWTPKTLKWPCPHLSWDPSCPQAITLTSRPSANCEVGGQKHLRDQFSEFLWFPAWSEAVCEGTKERPPSWHLGNRQMAVCQTAWRSSQENWPFAAGPRGQARQFLGCVQDCGRRDRLNQGPRKASWSRSVSPRMSHSHWLEEAGNDIPSRGNSPCKGVKMGKKSQSLRRPDTWVI